MEKVNSYVQMKKLFKSLFCVIELCFTQISILIILVFPTNYTYSERWILESSHFDIEEDDDGNSKYVLKIPGKPSFIGALKQELWLIWNS